MSDDDRVLWYERLFALFMIPFVCFSKVARDNLWCLFRYGVVRDELASKIKKKN